MARYVSPTWANGTEPALSAENLQPLTDTVEKLQPYIVEITSNTTAESILPGIVDAVDAGYEVALKWAYQPYPSEPTLVLTCLMPLVQHMKRGNQGWYYFGSVCIYNGYHTAFCAGLQFVGSSVQEWYMTPRATRLVDFENIVSTPTKNSTFPISSGGVYNALESRYHRVYGFHINGNESDPDAAVTYLADAVGATPAKMNYSTGVCGWGSWSDAFFLPRPCMLKYDGTVDYYLDPSDYGKKADGTASDVADSAYAGNAMMEWGQNGKKIWYKIVPDSGDSTSASVYIADYQADDGFHAWSFINNTGEMADHFYTPIYNGTIDTAGKLRSISGLLYSDLCQGLTPAQEVAAAEENNFDGPKLWYTEVYSDVVLINLLLILMGKSLDTQAVFGNGRCAQTGIASSMLGTGTLDTAGLFYGYNDKTHAVKVFGMENWWGNQLRRYAGHIINVDRVHKYKLTRGTQDGSTASDYVISSTASDFSGYLTGDASPSTNDYVTSMTFSNNTFVPKTASGGTSATFWCDYWYSTAGLRYALRGGYCGSSVGIVGPFYDYFAGTPTTAAWNYGAALSCKPQA